MVVVETTGDMFTFDHAIVEWHINANGTLVVSGGEPRSIQKLGSFEAGYWKYVIRQPEVTQAKK